MARKVGRGRLPEIDRLPEWADEAVAWAMTSLKERKLTQLEILDGLNERLRAAAWGEGITDPELVPVISRSAFNRRAMRLATVSRRMEETRAIAEVLTPKFEGESAERVTLLLSETIKTLTFEMLENAGDLAADGDTAEMLMMASRALKHAEEARRISADTKAKILKEFTSKAEAAVEKVAKMQGGSPEHISALKAALALQIRDRG